MADRDEVPALQLLGYQDLGALPEATTVEKLVLKTDELFAVTNRMGDIAPAGARDQGFFYRDTRFLSYLKLTVAGGPPVVLSSQVSSDYVTQVDMTVTSQNFGGIFTGDPVNFVHLRRSQVIDGSLLDRLVLTNYLTHPLDYWISFEFGCDFADVFEVRGFQRKRRGTYFAPLVERDLVVWRYRGLDGRDYLAELRFSHKAAHITANEARFELHLEPNASAELELDVSAVVKGVHESHPAPFRFAARADAVRKRAQAFYESSAEIETSDEFFNEALSQSICDLNALTVPEANLRVLAAGIPWYAVPFGRDSLLTAYQALPFCPGLVRDSLIYLAAWQGTKLDEFTEEEPGKIPHEMRYGEMAATNEIPHRPYYGTIDATPLFIVVLHEYLQWTNDRETVMRLLPAAEAALTWIERYGDRDGDGLLEYQRRTPSGLRNQGWKDSTDGVCFPDGRPCEPPIALVEVQGYAADAYRRMGLLYRALGIRGKAAPLFDKAHRLSTLIEEKFWVPEEKFFGIALDGAKRLAPTVTSNPAHLLWSHAVSHDRARHVAKRLLQPDLYSGWGIRTLAKGQRAYNPLSYHNGTVWPHDNSLAAMGLAHYGFAHEAAEVLDGLYHASEYFRHRRLPELFCGMDRRPGEFPVQYPVACSPQAWASASFLLLVRATLGLHPDAPRGRLTVKNPHLPAWLTELEIRRLRIGQTRLNLRFSKAGDGCFAAVPLVDGPPLAIRIELARHG